jgi:hypothetical protein
VRDLDRRERLDVDVRVPLLEPAEHLAVVVEARLHIESPHDVELAHVGIRPCLGVHLVHGVAVGAAFLWQTCVRAEHARLAQDADVRGVDVLVGGEVDAGAVSRAVRRIGEQANAQQIGRPEQRRAVGGGEALASLHFLGNGAQDGIAHASRIDLGYRHGRHRVSPHTA